MMELKPCPFCGSNKVVIRWNFRYEVYEVNCVGCNCTLTHWYECADEAINAWNRRHDDGQ